MIINHFIIRESASNIEALKKINDNKKNFLIIQNSFGKILGVLTEGDIRRAFIKGATLTDNLQYNPTFLYIYESESFLNLFKHFRREKINFISDQILFLFGALVLRKPATVRKQNFFLIRCSVFRCYEDWCISRF